MVKREFNGSNMLSRDSHILLAAISDIMPPLVLVNNTGDVNVRSCQGIQFCMLEETENRIRVTAEEIRKKKCTKKPNIKTEI